MVDWHPLLTAASSGDGDRKCHWQCGLSVVEMMMCHIVAGGRSSAKIFYSVFAFSILCCHSLRFPSQTHTRSSHDKSLPSRRCRRYASEPIRVSFSLELQQLVSSPDNDIPSQSSTSLVVRTIAIHNWSSWYVLWFPAAVACAALFPDTTVNTSNIN